MKIAAGLSIIALGASLTAHSRAEPEPPGPLQARLSCLPAFAPGRIVCELTAHATVGKLVWSDALVVRAPAFARPLRSRIVAQLGAARAPGGAWAKLALVASESGAGKLELLARGVICQAGPNAEWCAAVQAPVTYELRVATPGEGTATPGEAATPGKVPAPGDKAP